jgi:hypothetical protein
MFEGVLWSVEFFREHHSHPTSGDKLWGWT